MTKEALFTFQIENMLLGDLELLEMASTGDLSAKELVGFLDRIIVEDARQLPLILLREITERLREEVERVSNPETEAGN